MSRSRRDASARGRSRRLGLLSVLGPFAVLLAGSLVWWTTSAAFSGVTTGSGNTFGAGTVVVSTDSAGAEAFALTGLQRGDSGERCVVVTYGGSVAAAVRLYTAAGAGALRDHIDVTIQEGTGGTFASCSGFSAGSTLFTGTLTTLTGTATAFASGLGSWAPTGSGQAKTYRIAYTVSASAPSSVQNSVAEAQFVWEARNS